jgi:hypothetical protein
MKLKAPSLLLSAALLLQALGSTAQAAVWNASHQWNKDWDEKYVQWVKANWDEHFFDRPGTPYTGLRLDCADAVYSMRIIFSYENGLPFAMKDPTGGKKLITNEMSRFDREPENKRIRSFLRFIYGVGSTHSLPNDTYPVAISRQTVRSGNIFLTNKKSHHSWTIKEILPTGIPHLIFSSRPAKNTLLVRIGQPSMEFTFVGSLDPATNAGFRGFRHPEDEGKPVWEVPGYSEEQYHIPYNHWMSTVKSKLAEVAETPEALLTRTLKSACDSGQERVTAINEGLQALAKLDKSGCFNAEEYDNFSTPSRDLRLKNAFEDLRDAYQSIRNNRDAFTQLPGDLVQNVEDALNIRRSGSEQSRFCALQIAPNQYMSLGELAARSLNGRLSSNPHDSFEHRWGFMQGHSFRAKGCVSYE